MKKPMWIETVPLDLIVIVVSLFFGAYHSSKEVHVNAIDGIGSVLLAVVLAYLMAYALVSYTTLMKAGIVLISAGVSYMATGILVAVSTFGAKILANPGAILKAALPSALAKYIPDDDPINPDKP